MVTSTEIRQSNTQLDHATVPRVSVFVGGTSGIGKITIKALVSTGVSLKIYLIGRKSSEARTKTFIDELRAINPKAEIIWIVGEVSLLAEIRRVCEVIRAQESTIDLLFLTAGYAPFGTREETSEGLEIAQSLEYYSRILSILCLLPALNKAKSSRVVSVLGGGLERGVPDLDDLDLQRPGNFNFMKAQTQNVTLNTTALDLLAEENPNVTFIHSWPGWVNTGNVRRGNPGLLMSWVVRLVLEPLIWALSFSDDESSQRYLFQCTSAAFGGHGSPWKGSPGINTREEKTNGLFLVNYNCDCTPNLQVVKILREKARQKVWSHTQEIIEPYYQRS